jgi:hypothetical protein
VAVAELGALAKVITIVLFASAFATRIELKKLPNKKTGISKNTKKLRNFLDISNLILIIILSLL